MDKEKKNKIIDFIKSDGLGIIVVIFFIPQLLFNDSSSGITSEEDYNLALYEHKQEEMYKDLQREKEIEEELEEEERRLAEIEFKLEEEYQEKIKYLSKNCEYVFFIENGYYFHSNANCKGLRGYTFYSMTVEDLYCSELVPCNWCVKGLPSDY